MVHVVIVGGSGNVGKEIVAALVTQGKHQITIFTSRDITLCRDVDVTLKKVNYGDVAQLTADLQGIHTVLSFVSSDPGGTVQKNLIDACIAAGVKRFAPSEWGLTTNSPLDNERMDKSLTLSYLRQVNSDKQVLEYCLFQTGMYMNYLGHPHKTAKHLHITCTHLDIENKQALQLDDGEEWAVFTTIEDVAKVVVRAIGYTGKWPETGGITGSRIQTKDLIKLAEEIRGEPLTVHKIASKDLETNLLKSPWIPPFSHPAISIADPEMQRHITGVILRALGGRYVDVSSTWNELLPDMQFTSVEQFLRSVPWGKKE